MGPNNSLDWARDGQDWPNREASRFVEAAGIRWHVQEMGSGPLLLLLHGTGAATHSWRGVIPLLTPHFRLLAIDLPGHGFTQKPPQRLYTLPGMAAGICELLHAMGETPEMVAGHSAGAAVMLRMALDCKIAPKGLVSLNGALKPYGGDAARWLSPVAKVLFLNPLMPRLFAWQAGDRRSVERAHQEHGLDARPRRRRPLPHARRQFQPRLRRARHDGELGPAAALARHEPAGRAAAADRGPERQGDQGGRRLRHPRQGAEGEGSRFCAGWAIWPTRRLRPRWPR